MMESEPERSSSPDDCDAPAVVGNPPVPVEYRFGPAPDRSGGHPPTSGFGRDIPATVVVALVLQTADLFFTAMGLLGSFVQNPDPGAMGAKFLYFVASAVLYLFLMWKIGTRKDWARMILMNLTLLGIIFSFFGYLFSAGGVSILATVLFFIGLRATSVVLLFLPPSNRWFGD